MIRSGKKTAIILAIAVAVLTALGGCNLSGGDWGVMNLSITDAPLMDTDVQGVYITVEEVLYNATGESWAPMEGFESPQTFDLLALNSGKSRLLGQLSLPAGNYTQIRFVLGAPEENGGNPVILRNPGSWVEYGDQNDGEYTENEDLPLFVPSGGQSGYKAKAKDPISVPSNGEVSITADFDLRRAVVSTNNGLILKPVLRLIVDDEAGRIVGEVTGEVSDTYDYVIYAYEAGVYDVSETTADTPFAKAITSSPVTDQDGNDYVLPFLAPGEYEIVVAEYSEGDGSFSRIVGTRSGLLVTADGTTRSDIDFSSGSF